MNDRSMLLWRWDSAQSKSEWCESTINYIKSIDEEFAVVALVGPKRVGKSTTLGLLATNTMCQLFEAADQNKGFTKGIWVWYDQHRRILWMDSEGIGDDQNQNIAGFDVCLIILTLCLAHSTTYIVRSHNPSTNDGKPLLDALSHMAAETNDDLGRFLIKSHVTVLLSNVNQMTQRVQSDLSDDGKVFETMGLSGVIQVYPNRQVQRLCHPLITKDEMTPDTRLFEGEPTVNPEYWKQLDRFRKAISLGKGTTTASQFADTCELLHKLEIDIPNPNRVHIASRFGDLVKNKVEQFCLEEFQSAGKELKGDNSIDAIIAAFEERIQRKVEKILSRDHETPSENRKLYLMLSDDYKKKLRIQNDELSRKLADDIIKGPELTEFKALMEFASKNFCELDHKSVAKKILTGLINDLKARGNEIPNFSECLRMKISDKNGMIIASLERFFDSAHLNLKDRIHRYKILSQGDRVDDQRNVKNMVHQLILEMHPHI